MSLPPHIFPKRFGRNGTRVFPLVGDFPDLQIAETTMTTCGRQALPVRTKRDTLDCANVAGEGERFQPARHIPQAHGIIGTRRCQAPAVGAEGQAKNRRCVSFELEFCSPLAVSQTKIAPVPDPWPTTGAS